MRETFLAQINGDIAPAVSRQWALNKNTKKSNLKSVNNKLIFTSYRVEVHDVLAKKIFLWCT